MAVVLTRLLNDKKFTNEVICKVSLGAASDVDRAIRLAEAALPIMQKMPAFTRKKILNYCVDAFRTRFGPAQR